MRWTVLFQDDFAAEFERFSEDVQDEMYAMVGHLEAYGPLAKRPQVDTLKGSKIKNLKEFRFEGGRWCVARCLRVRRQKAVDCAGSREQGGCFLREVLQAFDRARRNEDGKVRGRAAERGRRQVKMCRANRESRK